VLQLYVICVAVTVGACSNNEVEKLAKVRDAVCACKTVKCAETALEDVPKGKVESKPRSQRLAREMLECLSELYEAGKPTLDPDAPSDPETSAPVSGGTR
jgi:hypothetical protein